MWSGKNSFVKGTGRYQSRKVSDVLKKKRKRLNTCNGSNREYFEGDRINFITKLINEFFIPKIQFFWNFLVYD